MKLVETQNLGIMPNIKFLVVFQTQSSHLLVKGSGDKMQHSKVREKNRIGQIGWHIQPCLSLPIQPQEKKINVKRSLLSQRNHYSMWLV